MNVLLLGALYSQDRINEYKANSKGGLQFAAQNLQESLIEGLIANGVDIKVLAKPTLSTYPYSYSNKKVDTCDFIYKNQCLGLSLGFINLPFLNHPKRSDYEEYIEKWYEKSQAKKSIWVYSLSYQLMEIALRSKKRHPDISIVLIVPDLLRFCGSNKYYKRLGLQKRNIEKVNKICQDFDKYVILCESMAKDLGISTKPYVVMEGIFSPENEVLDVEKDPHKVILYAGNLNERYGILNLLNAFSLLKGNDYRLWIRGNGSTEAIIKEKMKLDDRISLIPQLSKVELLKLEKRASLLVNPVSPKQDFTNFFFPSKTMDYLASGTPTIMHKLTCLPPDYNDHLYFFSGDTILEMTENIKFFFSLPCAAVEAKGKKAAYFIMNEKRSKKQVGRILDLL